MISTSENQVIYLGNGINTHFTFAFKIINYSDLHLIRVDKDGNETEITSDYYIHMDTSIVDYPGYAPGAEEPVADQPTKLQTGEKLVIYRDVPITQEDDMPEQWPFDVIESALDKSCIIDQQLQGQLNRSLKINRAAYTNNFDGTIPLVPGKSFRISEDGTKIEATDDPREARELADEAASVATAGANLVKKYGNALYVGTTAPTDNIVYAWINPSEDSGVDETPFLEAVNRLNNRVAVIESKTVDNYTKQEINEKIETKQNVLVAGNNITIAADGKTISATSDVTKSYVDTELGKKQNSLTAQQLANINADHSRYLTAHQDISGKQDKLTAGNNITITNNVISATSDVTKTYVDGKVTELSAENTNQQTQINKLKQDLDFQKMLAKGITYSFQTDTTEAYSKAIPSGAKVMDIKSVQAGKSFVDEETGELVTVSVENVRVQGENLLDIMHPYRTGGEFYNLSVGTKINAGTSANVVISKGTDGNYVFDIKASWLGAVYTIPVKPSTSYRISFSPTATNGFRCTVCLLDKDYTIISNLTNYTTIGAWSNKTVTTNENAKYIGLSIGSNAVSKITLENPMAVLGSTTKPYKEYTEQSIAFPTEYAVGKSAGTAYDTNEFYSVEQTDGSYKYYCKHTQRVGSVVLDGTQTIKLTNWRQQDNSVGWAYTLASVPDIKYPTLNILAVGYSSVSYTTIYSNDINSIATASASGSYYSLFVRSTNTTLTTDNAINAYLQANPITVYYELATPIETVTELSQNLFEAITVEGGGSITFVGDNENYHIPVANEEEYLIALNEV